jgi:hypothetical protein
MSVRTTTAALGPPGSGLACGAAPGALAAVFTTSGKPHATEAPSAVTLADNTSGRGHGQ